MRRHHPSPASVSPFLVTSSSYSSSWLLQAPHCCCSTFQRSSLPAPPNLLCELGRSRSSLPASISWLIFLPLRGEEVCASFPKRPQMPRLLLRLLLLSSPSFHCLLKSFLEVFIFRAETAAKFHFTSTQVMFFLLFDFGKIKFPTFLLKWRWDRNRLAVLALARLPPQISH